MKTFDLWLTEMANLFPQRRGDTLERSATTHMGFPVYAPTVYWLLVNRDTNKYPDGMTAKEIADEILERSEAREELRPGEQPAPDNWKDLVKGNLMTKFTRGLNSMLAKSPDFEVIGKRDNTGRGRAPSIYVPTKEAQNRQGGARFLKKKDREEFKKQAEEEKDDLSQVRGKSAGEMMSNLQSLLDEE